LKKAGKARKRPSSALSPALADKYEGSSSVSDGRRRHHQGNHGGPCSTAVEALDPTTAPLPWTA
jgi:hypothetical protein